MLLFVKHEKPSDCKDIDPETGLCRECGAYLGDKCSNCSAVGSHTEDCIQVVSQQWEDRVIDSLLNRWDRWDKGGNGNA